MEIIDNKRLSELLEAASESRTREFKSSFSWSDQNDVWLREKVIRAILGMTNTKYGGNIIIGYEERDNQLVPIGLTDEQLSSFEDYDSIKSTVDSFSYPDTNFNIGFGEFQNKKFIVITVQEFYEVPAICKKNGQKSGILIKDDLYVRSRKAPYSTIKATDLELREIIKMASDKERSELIKRGWTRQEIISAEDYYKNQLKDLEINDKE